jgi:hypothetical protein
MASAMEDQRETTRRMITSRVSAEVMGRYDDLCAGMRPLPKKPMPERVVPAFPIHAYNIMKNR